MKATVSLVSLLALLSSLHVHGDISYAQHIKVDAAGAMAMLASEGDVLTQIAGDKSLTESTVAMKSKLAGMFAGSGRSANIVRLDKALTWNLLPEKQEYSELTFAEARAQMEQTRQAMRDASAEGQGGSLPVSQEGCQFSDGEVDVAHGEGSEKIAGIKTRRHKITMRQSCTDPQTDKTCDLTWVMETWLAKKVPAEKEARAFREAYAEAMGMGDIMRQTEGAGQGLLSMFAANWEDVVEEFEKLEGYPLKTVLLMGIGGEQCTTESGQPIAMDEMWADASTAAYNAALDRAGYEAGSAAGRAVGESLGGSVAGSIGGAAVGAAAGELIGGLTGMFRKQKPEPEQPAAAQEGVPQGGQVIVFRIATEVTDWSEITIPAARFEVPAGWKQI
jgi:hypothetical protein